LQYSILSFCENGDSLTTCGLDKQAHWLIGFNQVDIEILTDFDI